MRSCLQLILFFWCFLLFSNSDILAQVSANVVIEHQVQDSAGVIDISWDPLAEKSWHEANDGNLEILGLKTSIRSAALGKSVSGTTTFRFDFPDEAIIEVMVNDIHVVSGEQVYLLDVNNDQIIFDFSEKGRCDRLRASVS